jgi:hypothetical protein
MTNLETVYKFTGIENLHCDLKGNFHFNDKPIKKVYNNGRTSKTTTRWKIKKQKKY